MIAPGAHRSRIQKDAHVRGWLVSVILHGTVALAAILIVKQIQLAPKDEPFKWNVAMVSPTQPVQPTASPPNQAPVRSVPSTTSVLSPPPQQSAPAQTLPSPQPHTQQPTSSISERTVTHVVTEPPALSETTPVPTQMVAISPIPSNAPLTTLEQTAQSDMAPAPTQMAAISPAPSHALTKRDYGWLSEAILRRVEDLKRYPASARVDRAEGKVAMKAAINEDGSISEVEVFQSSGHPSLDKATVETMRQAAPLHLPRPLGQARMTIKTPMSYQLDR